MEFDGDAAGGVGDSGARAVGVEQFEDQRRHGVDLRIARADERDGPALAGEFERVADAGLLVAEREAVFAPGRSADRR